MPPCGAGHSHPEASPGVPVGECQHKPDEPESRVSTKCGKPYRSYLCVVLLDGPSARLPVLIGVIAIN